MIQSWNEKILFVEDDQSKCIEILLDELQELYTLKNAKVLHVGAHEGEEVSQYRRHGFDSIVLIEANEKLCRALENKFTNDADIKIFNSTISDSVKEVEFYLHTTHKGSVASASILPLKMLKKIVPIFNSDKKLKVHSTTLDDIIPSLGINDCIDLITLDIQGAELMALKGGTKTLAKTNAIICEVNLIENYEGCALENEINEFLEKFGFQNKLMLYHELYRGDERIPAWGEGLWIKDASY